MKHTTQKLHTGFKMKGSYRVVTLKAKPSWFPLKTWLWLLRNGMLEHMVLRRSPVIENLIMLGTSTGLNLFLQHLEGGSAYSLELDTASIGSGNTAPADGDTDLETAVVENVPRATGDVTAVDTFYSEWFFSDAEVPNGTYEELGLFAGTQLFCRSIISPAHTKATGEDTLFQYTITAANS